MKIAIVVLLSLFFSGCGATLRTDESPPAAENGYDTAEMLCGGKRFFGLGVCQIKQGEDLSKLQISVQAYYGGTVQWHSEECGIAKTLDYQGNPLLSLDLSGPATKSCLITVTVSPKFSRDLRQDLRVYSFRGHLAVKVTSGEAWLGETRKVTGNWRSNLNVSVQGGTLARVVFNGCGSTYDKELPIQSNWLTIPLHEVINNIPQDKPCVLDGFLITDQMEDKTLNVLVHYFNPVMVPIPRPVFEEDGDDLNITADRNVSVISMDNNYEMDVEASFPFDKTKYHVVRLLTVKGRGLLCEWFPNLRRWTCQD